MSKSLTGKKSEKQISNVLYYLKHLFGCAPDIIWADPDGWVMAGFNTYDENLVNLLYFHHQIYCFEVFIEEHLNANGTRGMLVRIWLKENMPFFSRLIFSTPIVRDLVRSL